MPLFNDILNGRNRPQPALRPRPMFPRPIALSAEQVDSMLRENMSQVYPADLTSATAIQYQREAEQVRMVEESRTQQQYQNIEYLRGLTGFFAGTIPPSRPRKDLLSDLFNKGVLQQDGITCFRDERDDCILVRISNKYVMEISPSEVRYLKSKQTLKVIKEFAERTGKTLKEVTKVAPKGATRNATKTNWWVEPEKGKRLLDKCLKTDSRLRPQEYGAVPRMSQSDGAYTYWDNTTTRSWGI